ncbi:MAG: type VI secretion system accessory protein TagJ [Pseudomonadota bacterium]
MSALEALRQGDVDQALEQLQSEIRRDPANAEHRVFLFQLLCVLGDWDRALRQLNLAGEMDASALAMVQTYREALRCEALREKVFRGETHPLVLGEPEAWYAEAISALGLEAAGEHQAAAAARASAYDKAATVSGTLDGEPFEWIADADSRIGPFLEAVINGNYYWLPFERVSSMIFEPPVDLRDMVWLPCQITFSNEGQSVGLIPVRYPGSESSPDSALRLARKTEWRQVGDDVYFGQGQRLLTTDRADYPLLDVRQIEFAQAGD